MHISMLLDNEDLDYLDYVDPSGLARHALIRDLLYFSDDLSFL